MDIINLIVNVIGWTVLFHFLYIVVRVWLARKEDDNPYHPEFYEKPPREIEVDITKEGDQFYFWNIEGGTFIVQGKDIEEIFDKCSKMYPNTKFYIPKQKAIDVGLSMNA
ncbi:hypothetical protein EB118_10390 [bacterium]|nr:hypothetical protein [bacterium]